MQPVLLTVNGTGSSPWVTMDYMQDPFNVGIGVISTGTLASTAWQILHTFDDLNSPTATPTNYFVNSSIGTSNITTGVASAFATTAAQDMNYAFPVRAIRLAVFTAVATSIVTARIIQASNVR